MRGVQADDFTEKLLIHLPQNFRRNHLERIRAFGVIQPRQHAAQRVVVNRQIRRQRVRRVALAALLLKVENPGIIFGVGLVEAFQQQPVYIGLVAQRAQFAIRLDAAIFADAQENHPVNRQLHGVIQFAPRQPRIPRREMLGQLLAPAFDVLQKGHVHRQRAALVFARLDVVIQRAVGDGVAGKERGEIVPFGEVFVKREVPQPGARGVILLFRHDAAIIDREFLKVGENADRQFRAPAVAPQLVRRMNAVFDADGRLFRLHEKLRRFVNQKAIIRRFHGVLNRDFGLVNHLFLRFRPPLRIIHVPAERVKKRVNKLPPRLSFIIRAIFIIRKILPESFDKLRDFFWNWHDAQRVPQEPYCSAYPVYFRL